MIDHTILAPSATEDMVAKICDEAAKYGFASVCIPPTFVKFAKERLGGRSAVCTVVGFPLGYNTPEVKEYETRQAIADGAAEVDMVINIGRLKARDTGYVTEEIRRLKNACGDKVLKVIIEACLLTEEEKILACKCVTDAGADFIKTSTGFSTHGATAEDVKLLRKHVGKDVKVKAAGGIRTREQAEAMVEAGADRLGMSAAVTAFGLE
jgi:deoxyribose-phosphate aldolase